MLKVDIGKDKKYKEGLLSLILLFIKKKIIFYCIIMFTFYCLQVYKWYYIFCVYIYSYEIQ